MALKELKKDYAGRDFLSLLDYTADDLQYFLDVADYLKAEHKAGRPVSYLQGKTMGLIFEKSSTRTRVSFEAGIYYLGVIATYVYNRIMIYVSNGTLNRIRDDMFSHMESLPIKYFDTHAHGDIMSCYTNDTDTLRQMVSQSIPQLISASITVVTTFVSMVLLSPVLTVLVVLSVIVMGQVTKVVGGKSAVYFREQQKNLGAINGYIEEMINGQKVVKVFCHEEEAK